MNFNVISKAQEIYGELWKAIVRPPRDIYTLADLGRPRFALSDGRVYIRTDFQVVNNRDQRIVCSHFEPAPKFRPAKTLPCVIYLHGNCSSRAESISCLDSLLPLNITVVGFDFAGSGQSDGEYITLGWNEKDDLVHVIDYLREFRNVSFVALWGRSMGAVVAILSSHRDPTIAGMVCDSPFSNLRSLAEELAENYVPLPIPRFIVGTVLNWIKSTIKSKVKFDIDDLDVKEVAAETHVPAMFITGKDDQFVKKHHAEALFNVYPGDKWLIEVLGDHNSLRNPRITNSIAIFFYNCLHCQVIFESFPESTLASWRKLASHAAEVSLFKTAKIAEGDQIMYTEYDDSAMTGLDITMQDHHLDSDADGSDSSIEIQSSPPPPQPGIIGLRMQPPERRNPPSTLLNDAYQHTSF